ncbi:MAG: hypothetical protein GXN99_01035, partial [Candidatus Nanohaloarchaeota archaeon]|nr:hypothetical protein [Candidatus Nanohaloarchaeota archaeon]
FYAGVLSSSNRLKIIADKEKFVIERYVKRGKQEYLVGNVVAKKLTTQNENQIIISYKYEPSYKRA